MSETSPPPSSAVIQTAARLLGAGRAAEAVARLRQLVDEAPTYAAAHVLLASALDASGRPQDALEMWRRAAFLVPHSPLVHRERQRLMETLVPSATPPGPPDEASAKSGDDASPTAEPRDELAVPEAPPPAHDDAPDEATSPGPDVEESPSATASASPLPSAEPPLEMPLLPPEGGLSTGSRPPETEIELDDDGWTILEDDVAAPETDAPLPAAVLPPEPESAFTPTPLAPPESPPDPAPAPPPDSSLADDLDDLITQLDGAPRITPDPSFDGPKVTFDESSMDDMVSETLAKIYAAQHQYVEAAVVYEKLAEREPDQAAAHLERAAEMRDKAH